MDPRVKEIVERERHRRNRRSEERLRAGVHEDDARSVAGLLAVAGSRDADERRRLAVALQWFYLYRTKQAELEFESWLAQRPQEP